MKLGLVCLGIMVVLLSVSFASAQLSTDWRLVVDGVEALDNTTVTTLYSGQNNNIRLVYKAVHDAEDVRLVMQLYNSSGQFVGSKATQRFNIIQNTYYSTMLPFLVPAGISTRDTYVGHITLENDNESDKNNYPMIIRIELSDCQTLNQASGDYVLEHDITASDTCFTINADEITLDLQGHILSGSSNALAIDSMGRGLNKTVIKNGKIKYFNQGITLGGNNNQIFNIDFFSLSSTAVSLNGEKNSVQNITVSYGLIDPTFFTTGIYLMGGGNTNITDVNIDGGHIGIYFDESNDNRIKDSKISNTKSNGAIVFALSSGNYLINTVLDNNYANLDVLSYTAEHCRNTLINVRDGKNKPVLLLNSAVNINGVDASQVILCDADKSSLKDITVKSQGSKQNGLSMSFTDDAILENIFINNTGDGFIVRYSNNNTLRNITSSNNYERGISFYEGNNNIISDSVFNNEYFGFYLDKSNNNTLKNTVLVGNFGGIAMEESEGNFIYNNFLNNTLNMASEDSSNWWNTYMHKGKNIIGGRFLGGNFWAQPNGKGFSEMCRDANLDGLCDMSYIIDGSNVDEIPLARKNRHDPQLDK